jgi:hypothetical protein
MYIVELLHVSCVTKSRTVYFGGQREMSGGGERERGVRQ